MAWVKARDIIKGVITGDKLVAGTLTDTQLASSVTTRLPAVGKSRLTILEAETTVTSAQVLALNATPIQVVAAPGAGYYINFIDATIWLDYGTTAYAAIHADDNLVFKQHDASGVTVSGTVETTGFLDATADAVYQIGAVAGGYIPVDNKKIVVHILNSEVTTGDSPLKIRVRYQILPMSW